MLSVKWHVNWKQPGSIPVACLSGFQTVRRACSLAQPCRDERHRPVEKACCSPFSPASSGPDVPDPRLFCHMRHPSPWETIALYLSVLCSTSDFFVFLDFVLIWVSFVFVLYLFLSFALSCFGGPIFFESWNGLYFKKFKIFFKGETTKTHQ